MFKQYWNKLTSLIKTARENYYKSKLKDIAVNIKKTWEAINLLLRKLNLATSPH